MQKSIVRKGFKFREKLIPLPKSVIYRSLRPNPNVFPFNPAFSHSATNKSIPGIARLIKEICMLKTITENMDLNYDLRILCACYFLFLNGHVAELCPVSTILHRLHLLLLTGTPDGRAIATSNALESLFITLFSAPCGPPLVTCRFGGAI
jgi:hypothetical protein